MTDGLIDVLLIIGFGATLSLIAVTGAVVIIGKVTDR